jgi:hypothetical protein
LRRPPTRPGRRRRATRPPIERALGRILGDFRKAADDRAAKLAVQVQLLEGRVETLQRLLETTLSGKARR